MMLFCFVSTRKRHDQNEEKLKHCRFAVQEAEFIDAVVVHNV